jgi:glutaredoxin 3
MRFTIYSKEGCPYCEKIEKVLDLTKLQYKVYKLDDDFTKDQFYAEFGDGTTFPQVLLNDEQRLGGCTDTVKYLKENNIL